MAWRGLPCRAAHCQPYSHPHSIPNPTNRPTATFNSVLEALAKGAPGIPPHQAAFAAARALQVDEHSGRGLGRKQCTGCAVQQGPQMSPES